jgi:hypothetical protein
LALLLVFCAKRTYRQTNSSRPCDLGAQPRDQPDLRENPRRSGYFERLKNHRKIASQESG